MRFKRQYVRRTFPHSTRAAVLRDCCSVSNNAIEMHRMRFYCYYFLLALKIEFVAQVYTRMGRLLIAFVRFNQTFWLRFDWSKRTRWISHKLTRDTLLYYVTACARGCLYQRQLSSKMHSACGQMPTFLSAAIVREMRLKARHFCELFRLFGKRFYFQLGVHSPVWACCNCNWSRKGGKMIVTKERT